MGNDKIYTIGRFGNKFGTMKIWDVVTGECFNTEIGRNWFK